MPSLADIGRKKDTFNYPSSGDLIANKVREWIDRFKANLDKANANSSLRLRQSIRPVIDVFGQHVIVEINMEQYWDAVDLGRKPGKQPPPEAMIDYVTTKPEVKQRALSMDLVGSDRNKIESAAFLIGRKIGLEGTKGNQFYSDVINDKEIAGFKKLLSDAFKRDVRLGFSQTIGVLNKK